MKKKENRIIAVDFDGTLCEDAYPEMGEPNLYLIQILKELKLQGKQLILWTCRCGKELEEAVHWCRKFELEFDAVNQNVPENIKKYGTDTRKVYADLYLDDKAWMPLEYMRKEQEKKNNENN